LIKNIHAANEKIFSFKDAAAKKSSFGSTKKLSIVLIGE